MISKKRINSSFIVMDGDQTVAAASNAVGNSDYLVVRVVPSGAEPPWRVIPLDVLSAEPPTTKLAKVPYYSTDTLSRLEKTKVALNDARSRPNVVFLVLDAQGALLGIFRTNRQDLGENGEPAPKRRNISCPVDQCDSHAHGIRREGSSGNFTCGNGHSFSKNNYEPV
jgi:hypothetical protein